MSYFSDLHFSVNRDGTGSSGLSNYKVEDELLILLNSYYPEFTSSKIIKESLDRRSVSSISKSLNKLWKNKYIHKSPLGYKLTQFGIVKAFNLISSSQGYTE